ncbi:MAG: SanA/YdcF family protein [Treponema sp.]
MIGKIIRTIVLFSLACVLFIAGINGCIIYTARSSIYRSPAELQSALQNDTAYTALVLGAQVYGNRLSTVLKDRVEAGMYCYEKGLTHTLIFSGDHGKKYYDEVNAMRLYVLENYPTIDRERIFLDHAGFDTYDSIYRAKAIFEAEKLVIITQSFHAYRAVYIGKRLGLQVYALALPEAKYSTRLRTFWKFRESLACIKAFFDTSIQREPYFLGTKIPIHGSGLATWDENP